MAVDRAHLRWLKNGRFYNEHNLPAGGTGRADEPDGFIDPDRWGGPVEEPVPGPSSFRGQMTEALIMLSDETFQRAVWVEQTPGVMSSFIDVVNNLFDGGKFLELLNIPEGESPLTRVEHNLLVEVYTLLYRLHYDVGGQYEEDVLRDPRWEQLRPLAAAAAQALQNNWKPELDGDPSWPGGPEHDREPTRWTRSAK